MKLWKESDTEYPVELTYEDTVNGRDYEIGTGMTTLLLMSEEQAHQLYQGLKKMLGVSDE